VYKLLIEYLYRGSLRLGPDLFEYYGRETWFLTPAATPLLLSVQLSEVNSWIYIPIDICLTYLEIYETCILPDIRDEMMLHMAHISVIVFQLLL
jgi:hypothetical protein